MRHRPVLPGEATFHLPAAVSGLVIPGHAGVPEAVGCGQLPNAGSARAT
ncbi:hypothetical protein OG900_10070 [Streptomyces sp. NBC_00433]